MFLLYSDYIIDIEMKKYVQIILQYLIINIYENDFLYNFIIKHKT